MVIVFATEAIANTIRKEIAVTPGGVLFWAGQANPDFGFESDTSVVTHAKGADGRCLIEHGFSEEDADWLELRYGKVTGVTICDKVPDDWAWGEGP